MMEIVALVVILAAAATAVTRWTELYPMRVSVARGLGMAMLGGAAMATVTDEGSAVLLMAGVALLVGTGSAGPGTFAGRQCRRHIERIN